MPREYSYFSLPRNQCFFNLFKIFQHSILCPDRRIVERLSLENQRLMSHTAARNGWVDLIFQIEQPDTAVGGIVHGWVNVIQYLIQQGTDINLLMELALQRSNLFIIRYLFHQRIDKTNLSLFAIRGGHLPVLKYLLQRGVKIGDFDPVDVAIQTGSDRILDYLLGQGYNLDPEISNQDLFRHPLSSLPVIVKYYRSRLEPILVQLIKTYRNNRNRLIEEILDTEPDPLIIYQVNRQTYHPYLDEYIQKVPDQLRYLIDTYGPKVKPIVGLHRRNVYNIYRLLASQGYSVPPFPYSPMTTVHRSSDSGEMALEDYLGAISSPSLRKYMEQQVRQRFPAGFNFASLYNFLQTFVQRK